MGSWPFILSHMAAFIAGIALTGFLFWVLWKKVSAPAPARKLPVSSWMVVSICIYFVGLAVAFGFWLDREDPGDFPFVEVMLLASIAAICVFAWYWARRASAPLDMKVMKDLKDMKGKTNRAGRV